MSQLKHELQQTTAYDMTNFDGFDLSEPGMEGEEDFDGGGPLAGTIRLSFDGKKEHKWYKSQSKEPMPQGMRLIVNGVRRSVVKWVPNPAKPGNYTVLDQRPLAPGEKLPNLEALNARVAQSEWREDLSGKLIGPYDIQNIIFMIDQNTLDQYSWPSSIGVVGSRRCVSTLKRKMEFMGKYRGGRPAPIIELSSTLMPTKKWGNIQIPDLKMNAEDWVDLGGSGKQLALPERYEQPVQEVLPPVKTPAKEKQPLNLRGAKTITEPSLQEQMDDDIPYK